MNYKNIVYWALFAGGVIESFGAVLLFMTSSFWMSILALVCAILLFYEAKRLRKYWSLG
jgi:hypothetical protein